MSTRPDTIEPAAISRMVPAGSPSTTMPTTKAHRPDAGPDRIGGAERQHAHGKREQDDTDEHGGDRDQRRHQPREAVRQLEEEGPDDFEQAGKNEQQPWP